MARFHAGSEDALAALLDRYRRFARAKARSYFLVGADRDDVEQEAMIGLYKAARDFRPEHEAAFRAFAELCITRQIITAIKTATRQKHQALNQYVSISADRSGEDAGGADPRGAPPRQPTDRRPGRPDRGGRALPDDAARVWPRCCPASRSTCSRSTPRAAATRRSATTSIAT